MLEFIEPHHTGGTAFIRISEKQAIEYMKFQRPYPNDREALLDFIAIHWAYEVICDSAKKGDKMDLIKETHFKLLTTPRELREIADILEEEYPKLKVGDSTILSHRLVKAKNGELIWADFGVDQTEMEKEK